MKKPNKTLERYKAALAVSRENYASLLKDNRALERRNMTQASTIYRMRLHAKKITGDIG